MDVTGVIKRIEATRSVGSNGFETRNVVITTEEQYSQTLSIQFNQGNVVIPDNFKAGERVKIAINLQGREVTKDGNPVVYNSIVGWKMEKLA